MRHAMLLASCIACHAVTLKCASPCRWRMGWCATLRRLMCQTMSVASCLPGNQALLRRGTLSVQTGNLLHVTCLCLAAAVTCAQHNLNLEVHCEQLLLPSNGHSSRGC